MDVNPFNFSFNTFSIGFTIVPFFFVAFFIVFLVFIFKAVGQWNYNNRQPVLTVDARVVTKRENVSHHSNDVNGNMAHSTSTYYYATFEVQSGDRMELSVSGQDFGMLAEGDIGRLTFQGTRFKRFERLRESNSIDNSML